MFRRHAKFTTAIYGNQKYQETTLHIAAYVLWLFFSFNINLGCQNSWNTKSKNITKYISFIHRNHWSKNTISRWHPYISDRAVGNHEVKRRDNDMTSLFWSHLGQSRNIYVVFVSAAITEQNIIFLLNFKLTFLFLTIQKHLISTTP